MTTRAHDPDEPTMWEMVCVYSGILLACYGFWAAVYYWGPRLFHAAWVAWRMWK